MLKVKPVKNKETTVIEHLSRIGEKFDKGIIAIPFVAERLSDNTISIKHWKEAYGIDMSSDDKNIVELMVKLLYNWNLIEKPDFDIDTSILPEGDKVNGRLKIVRLNEKKKWKFVSPEALYKFFTTQMENYA